MVPNLYKIFLVFHHNFGKWINVCQNNIFVATRFISFISPLSYSLGLGSILSDVRDTLTFKSLLKLSLKSFLFQIKDPSTGLVSIILDPPSWHLTTCYSDRERWTRLTSGCSRLWLFSSDPCLRLFGKWRRGERSVTSTTLSSGHWWGT